MTPTFKTAEVAGLYDEVRNWCHPEYPFLDPLYSPGSNMPAIDYTPYVAAWLQAENYEPIRELWRYITYSGDVFDNLLAASLNARLPAWLNLSAAADAELRAIHLLTMRGTQDVSDVAVELAATTVGCRQLQVDPQCAADLVRAAEADIDGTKLEKVQVARKALDVASMPLADADAAATKLKAVPPVTRIVVFDYFQRDWGGGKLRFDLYYNFRAYGCGTAWNRNYVDWLGFFGPPNDTTKVSGAITKEVLMTALSQRGVTIKKSATRPAMLDQAQAMPGLITELLLQHCPEQQVLKPEWEKSVMPWIERMRCVRPLGAAMIKLLALAATKRRRGSV